jgi:Tol biopolymer transport system component
MTVRGALCVSGSALVAGLAVLAYPLAAVSGSAQRNGPLYAAKLNLAGGDNPDSWCLWIRPLTGALTRVGDDCPATAPLVSPNGHWMVYVEPLQGIIVRSLRGTPPRIGPARAISLESPPLAPFTYHYGWSPDSKRIAVMSSDGDSALQIVRRDGSRLRRITCSCPGPLTHLAWARRGPLAYTDAHRLYTVDPAGGKARRRAGSTRCTYSAATPTVSPNGRTALFVCGRRIVAVDLKRSTRRTFFNAARLPRACRSTSPTPFAALAWSPDARSIAVASPCGIVVMRADGSRVRQLPETFELEFDTELRWTAARSG